MTVVKVILSKAIESKMYSFHSRYSNKESARDAAKLLNGAKHAYYTPITERGVKYFDVRTEN